MLMYEFGFPNLVAAPSVGPAGPRSPFAPAAPAGPCGPTAPIDAGSFPFAPTTGMEPGRPFRVERWPFSLFELSASRANPAVRANGGTTADRLAWPNGVAAST